MHLLHSGSDLMPGALAEPSVSRLRALEPGDHPSALLDGRPHTCPPTGPEVADAASSRDGDEPAGKPALPVSRATARQLRLRAPASVGKSTYATVVSGLYPGMPQGHQPVFVRPRDPRAICVKAEALTMKFAQHVRSLALWERVGVRGRSGARRHFIVRGGSARPMIVCVRPLGRRPVGSMGQCPKSRITHSGSRRLDYVMPERAAEIRGITLTDFVVAAAQEAAQRTIADRRRRADRWRRVASKEAPTRRRAVWRR